MPSRGTSWIVASWRTPFSHILRLWAGVASATQPTWAYGGMLTATRPRTFSMTKNGAPRIVGSSSCQKILAIFTRPSFSIRDISRCCSSNRSVGNICMSVGLMRITMPWARASAPSVQAASNRMVSWDWPAPKG
jgi:hypothetical protein